MESSIEDCHIYGETVNYDCDVKNECETKPQYGKCIDKSGIMMSQFVSKPKKIIPAVKDQLPYHKVRAASSWRGNSYVKNTIFKGFESNKTYCGAKQTLLDFNPTAADYSPLYILFKNQFIEVGDDAFLRLHDPRPEWATVEDCGEFPCTGLKNVVVQFQNSKFLGTTKPELRQFMTDEFTVVSNNEGAA